MSGPPERPRRDFARRGAPPRRTPEFPPGADRPPLELSRRALMQLLGASAALATFEGCLGGPPESVLPYPREPRDVVPGDPLHYATSMALDGIATGLLVTSREGRPVKIEGNPEHPASLGSAGVLQQASLLDLYAPGRAAAMRRTTAPTSWEEIRERFGRVPDRAERADGGRGVALLLEPTASPLRVAMLDAVRTRWPRAGVWFHAPLAGHAAWEATRALCGRPLAARLELARVDRIVSFGADFLASGPFHLRYARAFARRRSPGSPIEPQEPARLYMADTSPTSTSSLADHFLPLRDGDAVAVLAALARELGALDGSPELRALTDPQRLWAAAAAHDLAAHRGRSLVIVGDALPREAHALGLVVNRHLGNLGETVVYAEPVVAESGGASHRLDGLVERLRTGEVDTLFVLGGNPVYASPGELRFGEAFGQARERFYLGAQENETAAASTWFVPESHYLESWGDARAWDGTTSIVQPLIRPLGDSRTVDQLLALLAGQPEEPAFDQVRGFWRRALGGVLAADEAWELALSRGVLPGTVAPRVAASVDDAPLAAWLRGYRQPPIDRVEISFRPSPSLYDGRFATNSWLLELPDPVTKQSWGNAALLAPATVRELGVANEQLVTLGAGVSSIQAPVLVVPGQAAHAITVRLGWGRRSPEESLAGAGFDGYALMPRDGGFQRELSGLTPLAGHADLVSTQHHWQMEGREIALATTLEDYRKDAEFAAEYREPPATLYQQPPRAARNQWGMTVDLTVCTGCSACVIACQAENNVPVVGPEGVRNGREMHWMRIDRYFEGSEDNPRFLDQPMLCQHCEMAPCEYVCPVNATVHSDDGLNEMIYNRCVGTRFCSNNCPYKVRRFNWFDYNEGTSPREALVDNPEVTVRERGVMEKCSYCVQRIRNAEIRAGREGRELVDGDVVTACQQACPTEAIVFGSIADPKSRVSRERSDPRCYSVLHDLGTVPRTRYLARVDHPNPELENPAYRLGDAEEVS